MPSVLRDASQLTDGVFRLYVGGVLVDEKPRFLDIIDVARDYRPVIQAGVRVTLLHDCELTDTTVTLDATHELRQQLDLAPSE